MLITLLVPEFLVGKALQDCVTAHQTYRKKRDFATEDNVIWTMMNSFYADTGGVALRVIRHPRPNEEPSEDFQA